MKLYLLLLIITIPSYAGFGTTLTYVAAGTTCAVNMSTIVKWTFHPKVQSKKTVKQVKDAIKGK
jgi:hypothetical protein